MAEHDPNFQDSNLEQNALKKDQQRHDGGGASKNKNVTDEPLFGRFPQWGFAVIAAVAFFFLFVAITIYCVVRRRKQRKRLRDEEKLRKQENIEALVREFRERQREGAWEREEAKLAAVEEENEPELTLMTANSATIRSPSLRTATSLTKKNSRPSPSNLLFSQDQRLRTLGPQTIFGTTTCGSKTVNTSIVSTERPTMKSKKSEISSQLPETSAEEISYEWEPSSASVSVLVSMSIKSEV